MLTHYMGDSCYTITKGHASEKLPVSPVLDATYQINSEQSLDYLDGRIRLGD